MSSKNDKRSPNPVDVHVGSRVRLRRMLVGLSQEKLGQGMGLTFQQIQKYEKGVNRIGASRLYNLARVLKVPVGFFFEGLNHVKGTAPTGMAEEDSEAYLSEFLSSRDGLELNRAFVKITDPKIRKTIIEMVRSLGSLSGKAAPPRA